MITWLWSHSYLRALCSSSSCSLTAFSSFRRAVSVPFTHVYTTSIGMGRQSLREKTFISLRQSSNCTPWPRFPSPAHTFLLWWIWIEKTGDSELIFAHAWLHLVQLFQISLKGRVYAVLSAMKEDFCRVDKAFTHFFTVIFVNIRFISLLNPIQKIFACYCRWSNKI